MNVTKFVIPIQPITKKNHQEIAINRKTGKRFIRSSEQYRQYEADAGYFIPKGICIDYPVNVKCIFYMGTKRKCDIVNHLEAIDDCLVKYGLVKDDNYSIIAGHDGSRVRVDRLHPRTEVYITKMEN